MASQGLAGDVNIDHQDALMDQGAFDGDFYDEWIDQINRCIATQEEDNEFE